MGRPKQATAAMPYLRRAVENDDVQKQLTEAATRLRDVYRRTRKGGAAAEDKKLYGNLREAATSIRNAVGAVKQPPKPKRRSRVWLIAFALAAVLLAKRAATARKAEPESPVGESQPSHRQPQESTEPIRDAGIEYA